MATIMYKVWGWGWGVGREGCRYSLIWVLTLLAVLLLLSSAFNKIKRNIEGNLNSNNKNKSSCRSYHNCHCGWCGSAGLLYWLIVCWNSRLTPHSAAGWNLWADYSGHQGRALPDQRRHAEISSQVNHTYGNITQLMSSFFYIPV